jgi:hypothetical protein
MSRRPYRVVAAVAVLAAVAVAWWFLRRSSTVTVVIVNASSKTIEWARVDHLHGVNPVPKVESVGPIPVGKKKAIRYPTGSESSYSLTVHFADGSEVKGGSGYAESGENFTDTVSDSAISSERGRY